MSGLVGGSVAGVARGEEEHGAVFVEGAVQGPAACGWLCPRSEEHSICAQWLRRAGGLTQQSWLAQEEGEGEGEQPQRHQPAPTPPPPAGRAVTIATRYTAVRRQTASKLGEPEVQVLDYDNVQQTLLPLMARAFSFVFMVGWLRQGGRDPCRAGGRAWAQVSARLCAVMGSSAAHTLQYKHRSVSSLLAVPATAPLAASLPACLPCTSSSPPPLTLRLQGRSMMHMYNSFDAARARNDFVALPELHALSSGLKALCTDVTAAGIETCRRQCGGHGYLLASGLPTLFNSYVQVGVLGGWLAAG